MNNAQIPNLISMEYNVLAVLEQTVNLICQQVYVQDVVKVRITFIP